jgi:hypothetical protein
MLWTSRTAANGYAVDKCARRRSPGSAIASSRRCRYGCRSIAAHIHVPTAVYCRIGDSGADEATGSVSLD